MFDAISLALRDVLSPPFRSVLWKSLALTIGLLAALWAVLERITSHIIAHETGAPFMRGLFLDFPQDANVADIGDEYMFGPAFLVAPVTSLFAGLFLDSIAEVVEETHYPDDPPGRPMPIGQSLASTLRFFGVVLLVNLIAIPLVFLLGFGFLIFLVANAYLLGREYFELAALRFNSERDAKALRRRHAGTVFAAGLAIAGFVAIPIVNLLAPLFATALMVHLQKRIAAREAAMR